MEEQSLKKVMYALAAVAVVLAGALAYIWYQKSSLVNELTLEKEELTEQMIALQNDYATLSSPQGIFRGGGRILSDFRVSHPPPY